jgi:hypothetical protein
MATNIAKKRRQQTGFAMSVVTLVAGLSGFAYQFMPDGISLTFLVCVVAICGMVIDGNGLDERENQLLLQSYGTAFKYEFAILVGLYVFIELFNALHVAAPIVGLVNSHWVGIMMSTMCISLGITGLRNFREIKD